MVFLTLLGQIAITPAETFENPKARPPRAKPQRRAGGESLPPLPLPATPLRRTERKRQPAPPALVGLIRFSGGAKIIEGRRVESTPMPTTQVDIERLMNFANQRLGLRYRYLPTSLEAFSFHPTELPLLYITGWTPLPNLPDETLGKLRRYLYDGGTLVLHAQCGRAEFYESARNLTANLFPKRKLVMLDTDSPIYRAAAPIDTVRIRKDDQPLRQSPPILRAVFLGCRPAVILSEIDLNCSWDVVNHPISGGVLYHPDDGLALGTNIITTVLANFPYARAWGRETVFPEQALAGRDQLVIAQVMHNGDWDPTPHGLANLMKYAQTQTTLDVQFKRKVTRIDAPDLFENPVLYMTGLRDFVFTPNEVKQLRAYLNNGGVLIADAAAGSRAFDVAFRRELKRLFPDGKRKRLPHDSAVYQMPNPIRVVKYSDVVKAENPKLNTPVLEGLEIHGQFAVIYSPLGLAAGWEQLGYAFNRGYSDADALKLGVNLLTYVLTH
ncbi:MAG: DUF4159 domain-containing protein [Phycisphaerae bacterium]|nr:DUF4159 domain-containing protein [Phycisphaerae bacterium]